MTMQLVQRDTLEGLAIPFGGPNRKDLQGEYFTPNTDLHWEWFPNDGRPTLYSHGLDDEVSGETIGRQISHKIDAAGVWVEVQLAKRSRWVEHIRKLLDRDGLGFSSGALPYLVKTNKSTGEILSWPWVELSATPTPASADARIVAMKYLADVDGSSAAAASYAEYRRLEAAIERTGRLPDGDGLAAAKSLREAADKLISGPPADNRHKYGLCACHNEFGDPILPGRVS